MKTKINKAAGRGKADYGWLKANYFFSFANYYNPQRMGFGALRVINDDHVAAGAGFPEHPHNNMEIITIPLEGSIAHKDSTGGNGLITVGEVQVMSAGKGIFHSEYNGSKTEDLKLFQIWIEPNAENVKPRYDQKKFDLTDGKFNLLVSPDGRDGSMQIHQNAFLSRGSFEGGKIEYNLYDKTNLVYLVNINGSFKINNEELTQRDSIEIAETNQFEIEVLTKSDILIIEVPE
jgi:quercetin 2,3-dioxygenase